MNIILAVQDAVAQGVLWGVMALGVYITFKVLNFADMTVDGSFALGGCITAIMITKGFNPFVTLLFALAAGGAAGFITGCLHTVLRIPSILAGILTQLALYSINLRILGRANLPLLKVETIFSQMKSVIPLSNTWVTILIGVAIVAVAAILLYCFFGTELGAAIRATGNNEYMIRALGVNTDVMKVIALVIANGFVAFSGAMVAQNQGFGDVSMGVGTIVIGLASIIIGEVLLQAFGRRKISFGTRLGMVIVGSVLYRTVIAIALQLPLGFRASDLRLLTAVIVAIALAIPQLAKGRRD